MKRTYLALAVMVVPTIGTAQEFTRYPGLSPTQQHLLEPIRTPPPEPRPSAAVPMIEPPPRVQSTEPQVTQFPGSSIDNRERRPPRGLKPSPQDRSKPPPSELTAPPPGLMERPPAPGATTGRTSPPVAPPAPAAPPRAATVPLATPPPAAAPTRTPAPLPPATTGIPPAQTTPSAPATTTSAPPSGQRAAPLANQTPSHWQTVTLPPAPDFSRRHEPARGVPRPDAPRGDGPGLSENAARSLIEADGYRSVSGLARGADGVWRGRALRGGTEVGVRVDGRGGVAAE